MNKPFLLVIVLGSLSVGIVRADSTAINELLHKYALQGAAKPDIKVGQRLWLKTFSGKGQFAERSCSSCHGDNLKKNSKHIKTNKIIKPMAPSVNPERLTKVRKIQKWFKRNCKWTLGRECTATEKANLLAYIKQQ